MGDRHTASSRRWGAPVLITLALVGACGDGTDGTDSVDSLAPATTATTPEPEIGETDPAHSVADGSEPDGAVELTASDVGVTESVIRVGAVFPDTAMIGRDPGDLEAKFRTIAEAVNEAGGVNGRTLELTYRSVDPLDDTAWDAVCVELTEDIGVFAAIGLFPRGSADCYAGINDTITISAFGISSEQMEGYSAPGITLDGHAGRLVEDRLATLIEGEVLAAGMRVAVLGLAGARAEHELYLLALEAAGVEVVADTIMLADSQDLAAVRQEVATYTEVWKSGGAEAVLTSAALGSQVLVIGYNEGDIALPMILPEGTGVNPSLLQDQMGLDLSPFGLATALIGGDSQAVKYETGADGVRDCVDAFQAASGEEVALDESRNNLGPTVVACQVFDIFVQVAAAAGPELTTESFAAAAEAFGPIEVTNMAAASLGPDKFDLDDSVGVIAEFDADALQFRPVD